ncbi:MAG: DUF465 domain-containing protein [Paracoccaceae bacterium]|nr:MAG: DUF465 domain-containing protein [Paracoccaceae bacterium]
MSHTAHELAEEFPDRAERLHDLKLSDPHFARLVEEYHEVNRAVHRAETRLDTIPEAAEVALRQRRVRLKDQISRMLAG